MINKDKWINSLPKNNLNNFEASVAIDESSWLNTIPRKNKYNSIRRYSFMTILFVSGLLLVSAIKNETRNLQKEINILKASNNSIKFDLEQAILDNEVITSPENISRLAKEYLNTNFTVYQKYQITHLNSKTKVFNNTEEKIKKKKSKKITNQIKKQVAKQIEVKKIELRKLQEIYSKPDEIPGEIKNQVAKKIEQKKIELKNLYNSPKDAITLAKAQKWAAVQVVKAFLGMPIIPGR
tara:strand:- start:363 stop:1076 length:714 start_codon:yes stop_codon:yes gene_type:complete